MYTYPTKATLATSDLILISDSADANKTKNATVTSIKDAIDVVDSITATLPLEATSSTGAVTISSRAYGGGATTGFVPSGGTAGNYLNGAGTWSTIDLTTDVNGILPSANGGLGVGTFQDGDLLYYSGASFAKLATNGVTDNYVLTAASGVPTWALNPGGGSGPGTGTQYNLPIWSTTSTLGDSLITQNAGATVLNVGTNIASFSTVAGVGSVFTTRVSVNGYSTFGGKLKLSSPDGATSVEIEGPANGGAAYTLKLPSSAPGNNQILQYTTSGNLGWINTPTGSGGISFSGSTANGIATYSNSTTATVSSVFTISSNKLSAPAGTLADPSIEVGAVGGLYAASGGILLAHSGADAIGVSSASIVNYKLTQFNSGLKFGSTGGTLNSYEEGTWTPSAYVPAGSAPTLTTAVGSYIKIGDLVNCYFYLNVTSSSSGNVPMVIASLPFSASNTNGYRGMVSISRNDGTNFYQQQATSGLVSGNQVALKRPDIQATNPSGTTVSITNTETTNASWYAQASLNYILEGTIIFKV
jgi:hypothetical protein